MHRFMPLFLAVLSFGALAFYGTAVFIGHERAETISLVTAEIASITSEPRSSLAYSFDVVGVLEEEETIEKSPSPYWWLSSGALLTMGGGTGKTIHGTLDAGAQWRKSYARVNPTDTDHGRRPQNVFRLVGRSVWGDAAQEAYFKITRYNESQSPNRNASNGILLFNRYQDEHNLYYAGVRVDGAAVVKKKMNGVYYTLGQVGVFVGAPYDEETNPNLLPLGEWIGLKAEIENDDSGGVWIRLFVDKGRSGEWALVLDVYDDGATYGGPAIGNAGHGGMRTDFMDAEFDDYKVRTL